MRHHRRTLLVPDEKPLRVDAEPAIAASVASGYVYRARASRRCKKHAGGILGGISSGQQIVANIALKPTSSITVPGHTINRSGEEVEMITKGRHDPCVGIRAVPIAEAMLAIVLMDHFLRQRAQNADVTTTIPRW